MHSAVRAALVQGGCVAALLAAGCARVPVATSGAAARGHLIEAYGAAAPDSRGSGRIESRHGSRRDGSLTVRWATVAESTIVVGYAGPVRGLDASLFGDSVYVALRASDLAFMGRVRDDGGLGAEGLRFLARPWDFGADWVRSAIERAVVDPWDGGWRMTGRFVAASGARPFTFQLDAHGDPRRLVVGRPGDAGRSIVVRYGATKSYRGGRLPQWIEWENGDAVIRLSIDAYARGAPARFSHPPDPHEDWTRLALDDPRTRDLLRRYLGVGAMEEER